ncbi:3'-5' exoribonuclease [Escherichia coli]|nr:3'-5' exoribonuclease [Escherichia coli]EIQ5547637.1 3'-5' exoribonuclease [Escherichia coli]
MNDLMIDTETTGTSHHSGIISFAAAFFNPDTGDKGDHIYLRLDWVSATRNGAVIDPETFCFWLEQSTEVRLEAVRKDESISERDATYALINFIEQLLISDGYVSGRSHQRLTAHFFVTCVIGVLGQIPAQKCCGRSGMRGMSGLLKGLPRILAFRCLTPERKSPIMLLMTLWGR